MKTSVAVRNRTARSNFYMAALSAVLLIVPAGQPIARAADNPNLAGTWKLNQDQSDNPREKMREAMGGGGGGFGGPGGGGFGGQGGGGQRGGNRGGGQGGRGGMFQDESQLTIEQNGQSVKISGASGNLIAQTSDNTQSSSQANGQESTTESPNGEQSNGQPAPRRMRSPEVAQWKNNQLVVVMSGRNGAKTTRTFSLSPDGKQLYLTTEMQNPRFDQPVTFRMVYDPVKPQ